MIDFADILSNYYVKTVGIPLFSVFMTTSVKVVSRKDNALSITRNDLAVGFNLIVTGLILLVNTSIRLSETSQSLGSNSYLKNSNQLLNMFILALLYCIAAFLLSVLVRKYGWEEKEKIELSLWVGVIIPLVIGGFLLIVAVNYSNI